MSSHKRTVLAMLCLAAAVFLSSPVLAADAPAMEPQVERILKAAADYLKSAEAFTFRADITMDEVLPSDVKVQYGSTLNASVKRPNMVRTETRGDLRNGASWYDGKTFTRLNRDLNLYAQWPAPSTTDATMNKLMEELGVQLPLSSLFYADPWAIWQDGVLASAYAGLHLVNGVEAHHVILLQDEIDAQVWVEEGNQVVLRKVVLTYKTIPGQPQFTALFSDWDFSPRLSGLLFDFAPPAGADRIEFLPVCK